jgi:hypothetical protein
MTYYILLGLEKLGIVWDLKAPPERMLRPEAFTAINKSDEPVPVPLSVPTHGAMAELTNSL